MYALFPWYFFASVLNLRFKLKTFDLFLYTLIPCLLFAYPGTVRGEGNRRFLLSYLKCGAIFFLGVLIPVVYFFLSAALAPDWKGAANSPYGCILETKIWLTPFALWAWVSFYLYAVIQKKKDSVWVALGLFTGFVGSIITISTMLLVRFPISEELIDGLVILFLSPLVYVPLWYGILSYCSWKAVSVRPYYYGASLLAQAAGWAWAAEKTIDAYNALGDRPPCYVVTASAYGYPWLVRPTLRLDHEGRRILESAQLVRLREFERLWGIKSPDTHRQFRRLYNVVGPLMAKCIQRPFLASVSYLALKPLEWLVMVLLKLKYL